MTVELAADRWRGMRTAHALNRDYAATAPSPIPVCALPREDRINMARYNSLACLADLDKPIDLSILP